MKTIETGLLSGYTGTVEAFWILSSRVLMSSKCRAVKLPDLEAWRVVWLASSGAVKLPDLEA